MHCLKKAMLLLIAKDARDGRVLSDTHGASGTAGEW